MRGPTAHRHAAVLVCSVCVAFFSAAWPAAAQDATDRSELVTKEGQVDYRRQGITWTPATLGQDLVANDRVRTGEYSRAAIRLSNQAVLRVGELSTVEILPPKKEPVTKPRLSLFAGLMYFFSRERPEEVEVRSPTAVGALRGTEFTMEVADNGTTTLTMIDGQVTLSNAQGTVDVGPGEQGIAEPGRAPRKTAVIYSQNIVQWALYYPGILNVDELSLSAADRSRMGAAWDAYDRGNPLQARDAMPWDYRPTSHGGRALKAAVALAVGQVDDAKAWLQAGDAKGRSGFGDDLRQVIAAVNNEEFARTDAPATSTAWLAESYYRQSRLDLEGAREAAREAVALAPDFGYAWARLAELEFGFGRLDPTMDALAKAEEFTPDNAQVYAVQGFILAAGTRPTKALERFERAIALDSALGNAWLGQGLTKIRMGQRHEGRQDLQVAAVLEPSRSLLRSYLGKAHSYAGQPDLAMKELELATRLDPNDPTPWLYRGLEHFAQNRVNAAIRDIERSIELNDNRRLYRSRLLLDQDRAVRNSNLASVYRAANFLDLSVQEASRAVTTDYANGSAHLFLANSYDALRDPDRIQLRYETPWFNSLLLANLLMPVGAGTLSQNVSQQEYSRLFEGNRIGFSTLTEYRGDGVLRTDNSQFGTYGNVEWSNDVNYYWNNGHRYNNDTYRLEWFAKAKVAITAKDTLFFLNKVQDSDAGSTRQRYDHRDPDLVPTATGGLFNIDDDDGVRFRDRQEPITLFGYHREWAPGHHTLATFGRLTGEVESDERDRAFLGALEDQDGEFSLYEFVLFTPDRYYDSEFEIYHGELQQILQIEDHSIIAGLRAQAGDIRAHTTFDGLDDVYQTTDFIPPESLPDSIARSFRFDPRGEAREQVVNEDFFRLSLYLYDTWQVTRTLSLTAGITYDHMEYPDGFRGSLLTDGTESKSRVNPKAALLWQPLPDLSIRGIYSRSLGGVTFDESVRLEPVQLQGFSQTYRSLAPASYYFTTGGAEIEVWGAGLDYKIRPTGTFLGFQAEVRSAASTDEFSAYSYFNAVPESEGIGDIPVHLDTIRQRLDYNELALSAYVSQMIGEEWTLGAAYRYYDSESNLSFPEGPIRLLGEERRAGHLHELNLFARYNHESGLFSQFDALFRAQQDAQRNVTGTRTTFQDEFTGQTETISTDLFQFREDESFWQLNLQVGYIFPRRHGEITVGIMNLTDDDYKLDPINPYLDLPRTRSFFGRVRLNF